MITEEKYEHLFYEFAMVAQLAQILSFRPPECTIVKNALVESFAVHARILYDFFENRGSRQNSLRAKDFLPEKWSTQKPANWKVLAKIKARVNHCVVHLTSDRTRDPQEKEWKPWEVYELLKSQMAQFVEKANLQSSPPFDDQGSYLLDSPENEDPSTCATSANLTRYPSFVSRRIKE